MTDIRQILTLLCFTINLSISGSYRILGVFPFNGKSHDVMNRALMIGLAKRNHQVEVITHFPPENPPANYKVIVNLDGTVEKIVNNYTIDYVRRLTTDIVPIIAQKHGNKLCELMSLDGIQKLVTNPPSDPPYDLVITEVSRINFSEYIYYEERVVC